MRKDKGLENNGDSESEDDGRKRRQAERDAGVSGRKATTADVGPSGHNSSFLMPEEQERIRLRRELRDADEKWKKLEQDRKECHLQKLRRESLLVAQKKQRARSPDNKTLFVQMQTKVQGDEQRLRDFLDNVLFSHIEQQLQQEKEDGNYVASRSDAYIDDVLARVEDGIIVRCQSFDPYPDRLSRDWGMMPPKKHDRMVGIFERLRSALEKKILDTWGSNNNVKSAYDFVSETCSNILESVPSKIWENSEHHGKRVSPILEEQYLNLLTTRLADVISRDIQSEVLQLGASNPTGPQVTASGLGRVSRAGSKIDWAEFIESVKTQLDRKVLKEESERWYREERKKTIAGFRHIHSRISIRQEFVENLYDARGVSLILFKGTTLASILDVSSDTLASLGWNRDATTGKFWRYSLGKEATRQIFKVQMDGEIVGIWTANGDIGWDERFESAVDVS